jgi:hypothetical protein
MQLNASVYGMRKKAGYIFILLLSTFVVSMVLTGCLTAYSDRLDLQGNIDVDFRTAAKFLKEDNTEALIGIALGDSVDEIKVERTDGDYWLAQTGSLHSIFKLKNNPDKENIYLFYTDEKFRSVACCYGNFFGIVVGEDLVDKVTLVLGEPDMRY